MKRTVTLILALLMILSLAACGEKKNEEKMLGVFEVDGFTDTLVKHDAEKHTDVHKEVKTKTFNNLSTAMLDLQNGSITSLGCEKTVAEYILAHNDGYQIGNKENRVTNFSMMTMDTNQEVYDILNNAIVDLKADGTLDNLIEKELKAYTINDPEAKELPHFDGAKTIKIAVTGDLPPMDFVTAYGKAAGFNIALLTEIANRAQVNIELVQIESGARPIALSGGTVDAVFWTKSVTCMECNETFTEQIAGTLITESYFSDASIIILPNSGK